MDKKGENKYAKRTEMRSRPIKRGEGTQGRRNKQRKSENGGRNESKENR
jgi:hypothetical protein